MIVLWWINLVIVLVYCNLVMLLFLGDCCCGMLVIS